MYEGKRQIHWNARRKTKENNEQMVIMDF